MKKTNQQNNLYKVRIGARESESGKFHLWSTVNTIAPTVEVAMSKGKQQHKDTKDMKYHVHDVEFVCAIDVN